MIKDGEVRAGHTRCDRCGNKSASVGAGCRCKEHKHAEADPKLKGAAEKLTDLHKAKPE